jgi:hypothetical protein
VPAAFVRFSGIDAQYGGSVGLDILLGNYNPCHPHTDEQGSYNDSAYSACMDSAVGTTSYFKHTTYQPGDTTAGARLVWGNNEINFCNGQPWCPAQPASVYTGWANKATGWAIEFYPSNPAEGGVRLDGALTGYWGDNAVSPDLGIIRLPRAGDPGTTHLSGSIPGETRFQAYSVAAFQRPPFSWTTSTGYPEGGFAAVENDGSSYSTPTLPTGSYTIVVWNNITGHAYSTERTLTGPGGGDRLDIQPEAPCFGLGVAYVPFTDQRVC